MLGSEISLMMTQSKIVEGLNYLDNVFSMLHDTSDFNITDPRSLSMLPPASSLHDIFKKNYRILYD